MIVLHEHARTCVCFRFLCIFARVCVSKCACECVCVCVCMCVCMCVRACMFVRVCIDECMWCDVYARVYVDAHTRLLSSVIYSGCICIDPDIFI